MQTSIDTGWGAPVVAARLLTQLDRLRGRVANLAAYLALRHHDLRPFQLELMSQLRALKSW